MVTLLAMAYFWPKLYVLSAILHYPNYFESHALLAVQCEFSHLMATVQISEDAFSQIKNELTKACSQQNSRSSKPAIYGAAAPEEIKKLQPLRQSLEVSLTDPHQSFV